MAKDTLLVCDICLIPIYLCPDPSCRGVGHHEFEDADTECGYDYDVPISNALVYKLQPK